MTIYKLYCKNELMPYCYTINKDRGNTKDKDKIIRTMLQSKYMYFIVDYYGGINNWNIIEIDDEEYYINYYNKKNTLNNYDCRKQLFNKLGK
jgi:hypothetical protein